MSSDKMSDGEFALKVDYEGGLLEALMGYGLKSDHLEEGDLKDAIAKVETFIRNPEFDKAVREAEDLLEDALAEYDEDGDWDEDDDE